MLPSKFYPIVDDIDWIERLLPLGVKFIQYRKKGQPESTVRPQIREALSLAKDYNASIVINDYWDIAIEEGARWVHLGQEDLDSLDKKALKEASIKLGTSTHNHRELDRALTFDPDYIALGPVFHTVSKKMVMPEQGLKRVSEWKNLIGGRSLVAIGGIRLENARNVLACGADSVACIGDISLHETPEERVKQWLTQLR